MKAFELARLIAERRESGSLYLEFLSVPSLSVGLYQLAAGGTDPQEPHTEDEVYYIVSGRASIQVDTEQRSVEAGSVVFVSANVEHRFHTITEDLTVLVFFAPAEYTLAPGGHKG
ncbi:MAG: cupin domain-containing protein [Ktedonobacteraceae bacterium]|nr:cupin domain-containing protein [Ktedonobacteraceae bacterium]